MRGLISCIRMRALDFEGSSLQAVRKMTRRLPHSWTALLLTSALAGCYDDSTTEDSSLDSGDRARVSATPHLRTLPPSGGASTGAGGTSATLSAGGTRASKGGTESVAPTGGTSNSTSTLTSTGGVSESGSGLAGASTGGYTAGGATPAGGATSGGDASGFAGDPVAGAAGSDTVAGAAGSAGHQP